MTAGIAARETNALARLAGMVPENLAVAIGILAKLAGSAFALYYAYDQNRLFPGEQLPRTWVFVGMVVAIALVSAVPARYRGVEFVAAFGAAMLLFGGANLAYRDIGALTAISGAVAWLAVATVNCRRQVSIFWSLGGLLAGWATTFPLALAIALFIEN